jgi:hypothetical protein
VTGREITGDNQIFGYKYSLGGFKPFNLREGVLSTPFLVNSFNLRRSNKREAIMNIMLIWTCRCTAYDNVSYVREFRK